MEINRETKILLLAILQAGNCNEEQRQQMAKSFGLYEVQSVVLVRSDKEKEIMEAFLKKE